MNYPRTFVEAQAMLATAPNGKTIGHNTRLVALGDGTIGVRFHTTVIVTFSPNGTIVLNSGGWRTYTTRLRINKCLPFGRIWQKAFVWYYGFGTETWKFGDGMALKDGLVVSGADPVPKRKDLWPIKVKRYAQRYVLALKKGRVLEPGPGDCFCCRYKFGQDDDHIRLHVGESYYVPSMLRNALDEFGASECARDFVINAMRKTLNANPWHGIGEEQTEKLIRRYILRHTGYAV